MDVSAFPCLHGKAAPASAWPSDSRDLALSSLVVPIPWPCTSAAPSTWLAFPSKPLLFCSQHPVSFSTHQSPAGPLQCPTRHLLREVFLDASQIHAGVCGLVPGPWRHLVPVFVITPAALAHPSLRLERGVCAQEVGWAGMREQRRKRKRTECVWVPERRLCVRVGEPPACSCGCHPAAQDCLEGAPEVGECLPARELGAEQGLLSGLGGWIPKLCSSQCPPSPTH